MHTALYFKGSYEQGLPFLFFFIHGGKCARRNLWRVINTGTRESFGNEDRVKFFPRTLEIDFLAVFPRRVERKQKTRFEIIATVRIMKISFDSPYDNTLHDKHSIY